MSKEMDRSWESEEVNNLVTDVVALKISITSDDCKHFAQICIHFYTCNLDIWVVLVDLLEKKHV